MPLLLQRGSSFPTGKGMPVIPVVFAVIFVKVFIVSQDTIVFIGIHTCTQCLRERRGAKIEAELKVQLLST